MIQHYNGIKHCSFGKQEFYYLFNAYGEVLYSSYDESTINRLRFKLLEKKFKYEQKGEIIDKNYSLDSFELIVNNCIHNYIKGSVIPIFDMDTLEDTIDYMNVNASNIHITVLPFVLSLLATSTESVDNLPDVLVANANKVLDLYEVNISGLTTGLGNRFDSSILAELVENPIIEDILKERLSNKYLKGKNSYMVNGAYRNIKAKFVEFLKGNTVAKTDTVGVGLIIMKFDEFVAPMINALILDSKSQDIIKDSDGKITTKAELGENALVVQQLDEAKDKKFMNDFVEFMRLCNEMSSIFLKKRDNDKFNGKNKRVYKRTGNVFEIFQSIAIQEELNLKAGKDISGKLYKEDRSHLSEIGQKRIAHLEYLIKKVLEMINSDIPYYSLEDKINKIMDLEYFKPNITGSLAIINDKPFDQKIGEDSKVDKERLVNDDRIFLPDKFRVLLLYKACLHYIKIKRLLSSHSDLKFYEIPSVGATKKIALDTYDSLEQYIATAESQEEIKLEKGSMNSFAFLNAEDNLVHISDISRLSDSLFKNIQYDVMNFRVIDKEVTSTDLVNTLRASETYIKSVIGVFELHTNCIYLGLRGERLTINKLGNDYDEQSFSLLSVHEKLNAIQKSIHSSRLTDVAQNCRLIIKLLDKLLKGCIKDKKAIHDMSKLDFIDPSFMNNIRNIFGSFFNSHDSGELVFHEDSESGECFYTEATNVHYFVNTLYNTILNGNLSQDVVYRAIDLCLDLIHDIIDLSIKMFIIINSFKLIRERLAEGSLHGFDLDNAIGKESDVFTYEQLRKKSTSGIVNADRYVNITGLTEGNVKYKKGNSYFNGLNSDDFTVKNIYRVRKIPYIGLKEIIKLKNNNDYINKLLISDYDSENSVQVSKCLKLLVTNFIPLLKSIVNTDNNYLQFLSEYGIVSDNAELKVNKKLQDNLSKIISEVRKGSREFSHVASIAYEDEGVRPYTSLIELMEYPGPHMGALRMWLSWLLNPYIKRLEEDNKRVTKSEVINEYLDRYLDGSLSKVYVKDIEIKFSKSDNEFMVDNRTEYLMVINFGENPYYLHKSGYFISAKDIGSNWTLNTEAIIK